MSVNTFPLEVFDFGVSLSAIVLGTVVSILDFCEVLTSSLMASLLMMFLLIILQVLLIINDKDLFGTWSRLPFCCSSR